MNIITEPIEKDLKLIENTKIIDIENFIKYLDKVIKKHKLNTMFLKSDFYILIPTYYNKTDIFLLTYTFKTLNYFKFNFIKESLVYSHLLDDDTYILNIWNKQGELTQLINNHIISLPFQKLPDLKVKKMIVINNNQDDFKLKSNSKNIYYLENSFSPIIKFLVEKIQKGLPD